MDDEGEGNKLMTSHPHSQNRKRDEHSSNEGRWATFPVTVSATPTLRKSRAI
jgi:hypothetical protein